MYVRIQLLFTNKGILYLSILLFQKMLECMNRQINMYFNRKY